MRCVAEGLPYTVFGYKAKQVRDNIHSADYVAAVDHFFRAPRTGGEVYNIGGGRFCSCSVVEAISLCEEIAGTRLTWQYSDANRSGDHIWWISDTGRFSQHFPTWVQQYDLRATLEQMLDRQVQRQI
jgi:CDP-paratose 2-epimerase